MNGLQPCASGGRAGTGGARDSPTGASAKQGQVLAAWERFAAADTLIYARVFERGEE